MNAAITLIDNKSELIFTSNLNVSENSAFKAVSLSWFLAVYSPLKTGFFATEVKN